MLPLSEGIYPGRFINSRGDQPVVFLGHDTQMMPHRPRRLISVPLLQRVKDLFVIINCLFAEKIRVQEPLVALRLIRDSLHAFDDEFISGGHTDPFMEAEVVVRENLAVPVRFLLLGFHRFKLYSQSVKFFFRYPFRSQAAALCLEDHAVLKEVMQVFVRLIELPKIL